MMLIIKHKKCVIKSSDISIKTKIGHNTVVMKGSCIDSLSEIGNYCYIGKYCYITKTTIGNYCSIANNVSIGQGEHDLDQISTNSIFYHDPLNDLTKKDCKIGNDVWIGVDSIVKRGVEIGDGAVIGANSVVTKDIPPYAIAVGNPAKVIRYRFDSQTIQNIQKSQWWITPPQEAKKIFAEIKK